MARNLEEVNATIGALIGYSGYANGGYLATPEANFRRSVHMTYDGFDHASRSAPHSGHDRTANKFRDSVELSEEWREIKLFNNRLVLVADANELRVIAEAMDLPIDMIVERTEMSIGHFMAATMSVNLLLEPASDEDELSSYARPSLKMFFAKDGKITAGLWLNEFSTPCRKPVEEIERRLMEKGIDPGYEFDEMKRRFKDASQTTRGWVAAAYAEGLISIGQQVKIETPHDPVRQLDLLDTTSA